MKKAENMYHKEIHHFPPNKSQSIRRTSQALSKKIGHICLLGKAGSGPEHDEFDQIWWPHTREKEPFKVVPFWAIRITFIRINDIVNVQILIRR
ncbi:hypothetical protein PABG_12637 [Paracoccidioides brasiliensis Pb03]|uniref:Uncharacterized protein n=2 Tax=Paracoccidioides brasiliensis TaxID=121759 RepID=A0A0A0HWG5_PARBD|nr:uncharacterized protein PADG_11223 [Paracoccidioides brasiliensis Pb18]KGM92411.1 hypothetical protein PADG_11223 [Paracoccidioides brasiliensis Pb18]KGY14499.1 hypothetical protein PABG_12637 [Paracoccidioides brasiliensis Pb03]ODH41434.1 hypothetical protein ACO22_01395 [Paracoccidioides brasiliensis]ODH48247.1 hypothetical protein GX48_05646 [Paracoccidioides brasiliensis]